MQTDRLTAEPSAVLACLDAGDPIEAARAAGYAVADVVTDAGAALRRVREIQPSLLMADAVLPGGDGAGLVRQVCASALNRYPRVVLMCPPGLRIPGEAMLSAHGAARLDRPFDAEALIRAVEALDARAELLPPAQSDALRRLLDRLGVPEHPGRAMLRRAVALAWQDGARVHNLRDRIYPPAAKPFGATGAQAERAIRHVIDAAWRTGAIDEQHRIFGNTIDARRGRPTCGEMIAQLADILRREG